MKQLEYKLLMDENNIELQILPQEIKDKIKMLKPTVGRYNSNPTDKLKDAITKQDIEIAEMIADYLESDEYINAHGNSNDDDDNDDDDSSNNDGNANANKNQNQNNNDDAVKKAQEEAEAKKAQEEADKKSKEEAEKKAQEDARKAKYSFGTLDMEKAILEECNANNGFIKEDKLISIIKKSPKYPVQEVFSIAVRKVYLKDIYKIES